MGCYESRLISTEAAPNCCDLQNRDVDGFFDLKQRKGCCGKKHSWLPRYCVLYDRRLYIYKDQKGKTADHETFVIDFREVQSMDMHSSMLGHKKKGIRSDDACCAIFRIQDKHGQTHEVRVTTEEEKQFWSKEFSSAISGIGKPLPKTQSQLSSVHVSVLQPEATEHSHQSTIKVEDNKETRRTADEYCSWMREQDDMLAKRERELCQEIERALPYHTGDKKSEGKQVPEEPMEQKMLVTARSFNASPCENHWNDLCAAPDTIAEGLDHRSIPLADFAIDEAEVVEPALEPLATAKGENDVHSLDPPLQTLGQPLQCLLQCRQTSDQGNQQCYKESKGENPQVQSLQQVEQEKCQEKAQKPKKRASAFIEEKLKMFNGWPQMKPLYESGWAVRGTVQFPANQTASNPHKLIATAGMMKM